MTALGWVGYDAGLHMLCCLAPHTRDEAIRYRPPDQVCAVVPAADYDAMVAALAAVERVRALHSRIDDDRDDDCCAGDGLPWPCVTLARLDGGDGS